MLKRRAAAHRVFDDLAVAGRQPVVPARSSFRIAVLETGVRAVIVGAATSHPGEASTLKPEATIRNPGRRSLPFARSFSELECVVRCSIRPDRDQRRAGRDGSQQAEKRMKDILIGVAVFAIIFGGALFGMFLGKILPDQHVSTESRDAIRIVMAMLATLSAVVLGLLTGSSISSLARRKVNCAVRACNSSCSTGPWPNTGRRPPKPGLCSSNCFQKE